MALDALRPSHPSARVDDAGEHAPVVSCGALSGGLAALLDRFTASVLDPDAHTVGDFAGSVQALHGELAMLAHHFRSDVALDAHTLHADAFDSADIFPDAVTTIDPTDYAGIADAEALEELCRTLSSSCSATEA